MHLHFVEPGRKQAQAQKAVCLLALGLQLPSSVSSVGLCPSPVSEEPSWAEVVELGREVPSKLQWKEPVAFLARETEPAQAYTRV